jgi:hypothetical protein
MGRIRCISRLIPERQRRTSILRPPSALDGASGEGNVQGAGEGTVKVQHLENVRFELPGLTAMHPEINIARPQRA